MCNARCTLGDLSSEPVVWEASKQFYAIIGEDDSIVGRLNANEVERFEERHPDTRVELIRYRADVRGIVCLSCLNEMNGRSPTYSGKPWERRFEF